MGLNLDKEPEPYFFTNTPPDVIKSILGDKPNKKGIKTMANKVFDNDQLEEALNRHEKAADIQAYLKETAGLDKAPSAATLINRIFRLSQLRGIHYNVKGMDNLGKQTKDYIEYNSRGIFIPAAMLDGSGFTKAVKEDEKGNVRKVQGQKFKVVVDSMVKITLTPMAKLSPA
jgi:hypothetical protein